MAPTRGSNKRAPASRGVEKQKTQVETDSRRSSSRTSRASSRLTRTNKEPMKVPVQPVVLRDLRVVLNRNDVSPAVLAAHRSAGAAAASVGFRVVSPEPLRIPTPEREPITPIHLDVDTPVSDDTKTPRLRTRLRNLRQKRTQPDGDGLNRESDTVVGNRQARAEDLTGPAKEDVALEEAGVANAGVNEGVFVDLNLPLVQQTLIDTVLSVGSSTESDVRLRNLIQTIERFNQLTARYGADPAEVMELVSRLRDVADVEGVLMQRHQQSE